MKSALVAAALAAVPSEAAKMSASNGPIAKVMQMLSELQGKIIKDGENVQKEYAEFAEWCEDRSRELGFEIKEGKATSESLTATISEEKATQGSLTTKVSELAADISSNEADLKEATTIRTKEAKDFATEDKQLMQTIDMLERATGILEREMQGGASMLQLKSASNLAQAFTVMVQASMIESSDADALSAFVQDSQKAEDSDEDEDEALGAPAADSYQSKSGSIVDTLQDLTEKAEKQLADLRKKETTAKNNYELLKQSLEDEIKFSNKDMGEAKKAIAKSGEIQSSAEGKLTVAKKELKEDVKSKSVLHRDCMSRAQTFQADTLSRADELKAIVTAKQLIKENTGGVKLTQTVSFVQLTSEEATSAQQVGHFVRDLARRHRSRALMQLASQISTVMHTSADPFVKVKKMLSSMIKKLEEAAGADAAKKAYCDRQIKDTTEKKEDRTDEVKKLTTSIDQMQARSSKLTQEVAELENQLSKLAKSQAEMDKLRKEEKDEYDKVRPELEQGLKGVKSALQVLSDYYGSGDKSHGESDGGASGIIGLLEVVEADLSKKIAEIISNEESAIKSYTEDSNQNEVVKVQKEQDVKFKTKESKELGKSAAETKSDRTGVSAELTAVTQYYSKIQAECGAKTETYAERRDARAKEIAGLKEALTMLDNDASLLEEKVVHRTLRGARHPSLAVDA